MIRGREVVVRSLGLAILGTVLLFHAPVLGQEDALAPPSRERTPRLALPKPTVVPRVVGKMATKKKKPIRKIRTVATPTVPVVETPTATPQNQGIATATPSATPVPALKRVEKPDPSLPKVTTIPNPARGDKVIFRVLTQGPARAQLVIYDRAFNEMVRLSGEGDRLFDILWGLKRVPEGIYHFQGQVQDKDTGEVRRLPIQNFAVEKDPGDAGTP